MKCPNSDKELVSAKLTGLDAAQREAAARQTVIYGEKGNTITGWFYDKDEAKAWSAEHSVKEEAPVEDGDEGDIA